MESKTARRFAAWLLPTNKKSAFRESNASTYARVFAQAFGSFRKWRKTDFAQPRRETDRRRNRSPKAAVNRKTSRRCLPRRPRRSSARRFRARHTLRRTFRPRPTARADSGCPNNRLSECADCPRPKLKYPANARPSAEHIPLFYNAAPGRLNRRA